MTKKPNGTGPARPSRWLAAPVLLASVTVVAAGCSHGDNTSDDAKPSGGVNTVNLSLEGDACKVDTASVPAGPVTFNVINKSAPSISEVELIKDQRILGEKENLAPGLPQVSFTVTLDGGKYQLYCPGAATEFVDFEVTGQAAAAPTGSTQDILKEGAKGYAAYINEQITLLVAAVKVLDTAVQAGDVEAAKTAYVKARPYYEHAESSVEGFLLPGTAVDDNNGNLDYLIDMRQSNLDEKVGWSGFHAIERDLWGTGITGETKKLSTALVTNVGKLAEVVKTLEYKPEDLANGAADLLEEVQNTKITGEEEAFSHTDLVDFAANVEGAQQAYAALRPGLLKIDANLVEQIDAQFVNVQQAVDKYRDPSAPGGFKPWTPEVRKADAASLTAVIQPLHDSLSTIAQKVATA
ncbi:lipoprotein [Mycolicibacterium insubricum]|uniref:iron uptake system protein EfeO n=1 Tax=Mycolicibacterium insubricum TaxID=444597 RepID=UPI0009F35B42|nr:iron uptake system protein EfeO [Mycolicibacterium insubricum]MCB9441982.1 peptidase M75 family protein [Mycolicibacterium sp.]MCV7082380.1 peptidase M75 family protein [Mycolicibacterium insubricum]BBZ68490.1 lipoprotein [Mycolicibacterium insubricum]